MLRHIIFAEVIGAATEGGRDRVPDKARQRYASLYQRELNEDLGSTLTGSLLERRAPTLLRLAMVFALTDRTWHIEQEHIDAAMAWVRYATDSGGFELTGGNSTP